MGRPLFKTDVDELDRAIRKYNAVCSGKLLQALRANHGEPVEVIEPEEEPEPTQIPDPIPNLPVPPPLSGNKVEQIKRIVCRRYNLTKEAIDSHGRTMKLVLPRQIAMYLARKLTNYSLNEIGRRFGGRDHATIHYAFHKVEGLVATDEKLAAQIAEMQAELPA